MAAQDAANTDHWPPAYADVLTLIERADAGDAVPLRQALTVLSNPAQRDLVQARLAAATLDLRGTRRAVRRLMRRQGADAEQAVGLAVEANVAFARADYRLAAADSRAWLALPPDRDPIDEASGMRQLEAIAASLARAPYQRVARAGGGSVAAWRDKAGLLRIQAAIAGTPQEFVLDTGANLSVIAASVADKLGLKIIGSGSIRSATRQDLAARFAIADQLVLAGAELYNVAFLVVNDADLEMPLPGGYRIPAIIGFPVFQALGRVTFEPNQITLGGKGLTGEPAALVASGSDLYAEARVNQGRVPMHLDTGASTTVLGQKFAAEHRVLVESLPIRAVRTAGAGGTSSDNARILPRTVIALGSTTIELAEVGVEDTHPGFGTLGQDVLMATGGYTLDLTNMKLTLAARAAGTGEIPPGF